jgi:hypothetical protein
MLVVASVVSLFAQQRIGPWVIPPIANPFGQPPATAPPPTAAPAATLAAGAPVVVELFTNNDCPACDAAESELNRLATTQPVPGARVIPLAFHVDFYGGATKSDPYVLPAATQRQQTYDAARGRVYTPQAIVDGDREFNGSEDATARSAVAAAVLRPKVGVAVSRSARVVAPPWLPVSIRYGAAGAGVRAGVTLTAVVTESGIVVNLPQSEGSGGRTLMAPIVRSIQEVGSASLGGGAAEANVAIPAGAVGANLTVVVLLEEASTHHVVGVGTMAAGAF